MLIKYTKWPFKIPKLSTMGPSKIYQKWDFGMKIHHVANLEEDIVVFLIITSAKK
jgi:hypothetical protein